MTIPKKYQIAGGALIVVLLVAVIVLAVLLMNKDSETGKQNNKTGSASTSTPKSEYSDAELFKIGETVKYQSVDLKVNTAKVSDTIAGDYGSPVFADEGTKFVTVNLTVTNTTKQPFTYSPFVLIDQQDRLFNSYDETIGNIPDYLEVAELSPSVPKTGNAVYQVPKDSSAFRLGGRVGDTSKIRLVQFQAE